MLCDAHLPTVTLRQVLQTTKAHENALSLAEELAGFIWDDLPEKSRDYAVALLVRWYERDGLELPRLPVVKP